MAAEWQHYEGPIWLAVKANFGWQWKGISMAASPDIDSNMGGIGELISMATEGNLC